MKNAGSEKMTLFNVDCKPMRVAREQSGLKLYDALGLEKPKNKISLDSTPFPLVPAIGDFYFFPWRHLSQTIVGGGTWKATDFSEGNVLKRSTKLVKNIKAFTNHNLCVGEEIGYVGDPEFTAPYTNDAGDKIPGGIDAPFVIDGILFPKLVRQLSSPVSPIDSASVTVIFEWEASHDFEHEGDFFWHLGEMVDDEMVRRIVKNIIQYEESSLVWSGADPYAKMLDDKGEVKNIDRNGAYEKATAEKYSDFVGKKYFVFDCLDSTKLLHLSKSGAQFSQPEKLNPMKKELIDYLASIFKTTPEKIQSGDFKKEDAEKFMVLEVAAHTALKTNADNFTKVEGEKATLTQQLGIVTTERDGLKTDKTKLEGEKVELEKNIKTNEALAKIGDTVLKAAKESAKKYYGIFAKGKPEQSIVDEISNSTEFTALDAKVKMWGGQLMTAYGPKCTTCNSSEHIVFRSSVQEPDANDPAKETSGAEDVSMQEHFVK